MPLKSYKDLQVWQAARLLTGEVYDLCNKLPKDEVYGLCSQLKRSAVSIPSNIAEGQGRRSTDEEFVRFLRIGLGSLSELETQLDLSVRLKFITPEEILSIRPAADEVGRLLNGLIRSKQH